MRVPGSALARLTYCTNVHPGESLTEVVEVLRTHVAAVKGSVCPSEPFGVGLRLSARAAYELQTGDALARLQAELDGLGLYVFTLNGFPYGTFHGERVKEEVYRPDWREVERVEYTRALTRGLGALLPAGVVGSISTVPGSFGERAEASGARRTMASNIALAAAELVRLEAETGKELCLALEPEPACVIETSEQAIAFFEEELLSREVRSRFAELVRCSTDHAEGLLRRHVGLCLDTCHASVEFESPLGVLRRFLAAGLRVPKIQISAGLVARRPSADVRLALASFAEGSYLHQTVVRSPGGVRRFVDLPQAIAAAGELPVDSEWRVHFHVPVFLRELEPFSSTQADLVELLGDPETARTVPHLEVETYTFDVLPERYKTTSVVPAIARELEWTLAALSCSAQPEMRPRR